MKLRYYMRGLGIGIIVTALIMGIGSSQKNTTNDNTDSQMAETEADESQAVVLADLIEDGAAEADHTSDAGLPSEAEPADTPSATKTQMPAKTSAPTPSPASTPTPSPASPPTPSPASAQEDTSVQDTESTTVTFIIENGTGSETVSKNLEEAGLIENASSFNRFLCDNGYSKSIRAGSFEIPVGLDESEIAGIITGKR